MDNEDRFITSIHNYCDRWCERCEFTDRCRVFAMEAELAVDDAELGSDQFVRSIESVLDDAKKMLTEKAAEFGIDLDAADTEEFAQARKLKKAKVEGDGIALLAEKYAFDLQPILSERNDWLLVSPDDDEMIEDVLAVIYWYQFFIAAKIQRGLNGILDEDGDEDGDELRDSQSDANGSIKIALISIERSILAWTYLLDGSNAAVIRPLIEQLESIKQMTESRFPYARDFIRPGFDEIGMVM
jgi:hypothetical protein